MFYIYQHLSEFLKELTTKFLESKKRIRHNRLDLRQRFIVVHYVVEAEPEYAQHVDRQRDEEEEEEPVVPPPDAVVHPRAVVVERLWIHIYIRI